MESKNVADKESTVKDQHIDMQLIIEKHNHRLVWYDPGQSILLLEITAYWSWAEAEETFRRINELIAQTDCQVYLIFEFSSNVPSIPTGPLFKHVRALMSENHDNEQLNIFVRVNPLLKQVIHIASRTYGLREMMSKYRFANTRDEALDLIEEHRRTPRKI